MHLFKLLERSAHQWPDEGAVYLGTQRVQTWAQLHRRSLALGGALAAQAPAGSRIALASENTPQYLELMFGTWAAQQAIVPLNYKLHAKEMAQIIEDADVSRVFASPAIAEGLRTTLPAPWRDRLVVIGSADYERLFEGPVATVGTIDPQALAWLFYTSGTTGRSKGAMLSHRNLMVMTMGHLADVEVLDEHCSQIHAAPMSHGSGLYIPTSIARGARQVIPASQGFDAAEFLQLCDQHPGCGAFLAPTMVQRLRLAAEASGHVPKGLRSIVYGGAPMYVEELKKSIAVFGQVFAQIYGQGEAPMTITGLRRQDHASTDEAVLGSAGVPRTGVEVRVVDEQGQDVPQGEIGEIIARGDVVMSGYWNNPKGTAEALREGWLYTGDMGSFDARGYLTLRDRSKDVVISGGSNIYPREVEEALLTHPGVSEVSVIGQPDPEWGEVVIACVVRVPGGNVSAQELDAHCLESIARFKRPKRYVFLEALPKSSYGKILKRELRQQVAATARGAS
ncbi:AMP-binding protein [Ramlibacter sp.]|uniref:AMP-binding protein n=1 Tax=Ramlibacter sp. TaxID=1917967 RepID=UPI0035B1DEBF